jgi:hypothetical protein
MFSKEIVNTLLQPNSTELIEVDQTGNRFLGASYIPSMKWYVVVNISKTNEYID